MIVNTSVNVERIVSVLYKLDPEWIAEFAVLIDHRYDEVNARNEIDDSLKKMSNDIKKVWGKIIRLELVQDGLNPPTGVKGNILIKNCKYFVHFTCQTKIFDDTVFNFKIRYLNS